jgi:hypothetical protein
MKLFYEPLNIYRTENDQSVIDTLLRKGWTIVPEPTPLPAPPPYSPSPEEIRWDEYSQAVEQGFLVQPENFKLRLWDEDRAVFSQMLALIKEALDLGIIDNSTPQKIKDFNGQIVTVSTLRFREIMVAYGFYYKTLWDQLNNQSLSS